MLITALAAETLLAWLSLKASVTLAITVGTVLFAGWLLVRSWTLQEVRLWALAWTQMAVLMLLESWLAQYWLGVALAWQAAYWRDIGALQKQIRQLSPTRKIELCNVQGFDFHDDDARLVLQSPSIQSRGSTYLDSHRTNQHYSDYHHPNNQQLGQEQRGLPEEICRPPLIAQESNREIHQTSRILLSAPESLLLLLYPRTAISADLAPNYHTEWEATPSDFI